MNFILILPPPSFDPLKPVKSYFIPTSALYLAECLIKENFSVSIIDEENEETFKKIHEAHDDQTIAFGISTLSGTQLKNALIIAKYIRKHYPSTPIIWGGAHVNALPHQTLESDLVDYICWGESEHSLPTLLKSIKGNADISKIKGIGYKKDGKCIVTGTSGYTDLNRIFNLPYHLLNIDKYARNLYHIGVKRLLSVVTSRGCPFMCTFCSNTSRLWPNRLMRYHTIDHVLNDIKILVNTYNADAITLSDENIIVNEKRLVELCTALKNANLKIKYRFVARIDSLDRLSESTWELLKETGVIGLGAGIESGSQRILDLMRKKITLEQIYSVDAKLTKYGFYKSYNFMTCVPSETIQDVRETLKLIVRIAKTSKKSPFPFTQLYKYIPLPNTEMFDLALEYGLKLPQDITGWIYFDLDNVNESMNIVRPWLKDDLAEYVKQANNLVEELNSLYIGEGSDYEKIDKAIEKMESFIENTPEKMESFIENTSD